MQKDNVRFEVLHLPPENTNSVLVSNGCDCVIFDAWGRATDWMNLLNQRGLNLCAIYSTHGHPDHISAAGALAREFDVDWFINAADNIYIGDSRANDFLAKFGLAPIPNDCKAPKNISRGVVEILPGIKMQIVESPGHTPGGLMFYFPDYKILLIGDTLFQESVGRYDLPGGDEQKLFSSIRKLYEMNLDDDVYVVHGHGVPTTIGWLKQNNPYFRG